MFGLITLRFSGLLALVKKLFFWMVTFLLAISMRCHDLAGITSIIRILGLTPICYDRLLDFLHSPGVNIDLLTSLWSKLVLKIFPSALQVNGRFVLVGDGIKIAKSGRKMPAVKRLHQESESNTKPEYIMGHSCQAVALLVGALESVFAVPLICRIHEGIVFSNRDKRTLLDKMLGLVCAVSFHSSAYLVVDAYYAAGKIVKGLLAQGHHLIVKAKSNAVAYLPPPQKKGVSRGRPKIYGNKVKLKNYFKRSHLFTPMNSPISGDKNRLEIYVKDLLWRSSGTMVRFVLVIHPNRGRMILMCTDLTLSAQKIIQLYGLRFKIECTFKQAIHTVGTFAYHFWMKQMKPIHRNSGNQYLHRQSDEYRLAVKRKMNVYHRHIQLGIIAQGLMQYLSCTHSQTIWQKFNSWLRTIRPGIPPSEQVVGMALKNCFPEFLAVCEKEANFKKFLREKIDLSRVDALKLAA